MLQDDFDSSDQEIRLKALKRVKLVADVLGPEVTRSELIPFINSECSLWGGASRRLVDVKKRKFVLPLELVSVGLAQPPPETFLTNQLSKSTQQLGCSGQRGTSFELW